MLDEGCCQSIGWVLPIDDTHFRIYTAARVRVPGELQRMRSKMNGKLWEELTDAEHQIYPGDFEAMQSQGPITWHNHEHLGTTDQGIVMLRRFMLRQVKAVQEGKDPAGVVFEEGREYIDTPAGNWFEPAKELA